MPQLRIKSLVSHKKRQILLTFTVMALVGGCATSPTRFKFDYSGNEPKPAPVASNAPNNVLKKPASQASRIPPVQPVGYSDATVMTAPVIVEEVESDPRDESPAEIPSPQVAPKELAESIPPGAANEVGGTQQPVEYFVSIALGSHPKIRAAHQRVAAATNVAPQVRALPDPTFKNTFWPIQDQALQTAGGRVGHQFALSQGVPWPEKLRTKAAIANREVQMARAEVDRIEREVAESVRLAYYEVWFATRAIAIVEETRDLIDDLTQVAEARYKSGGTQQDVIRAQLEGDRLDERVVTLTQQKKQAQADLAALVQQPVSLIPEASEELGLTDVPRQLDELLALSEQCSPELRAIAWEIQRDRQKQRLACLQKYPDLQLGLNYSIIDDDSNVISPVANGHDNISLTVGTTLPIWREKINAGVREAAHRTSSSAQRLQAERDAIYGKLRRLMAQADALVAQQDIYNKRIIPRTEDTLKLSFADYRGKRTDFFALIETYRELLMFETQLARFQATLAGTVAQIERTVGCPTQ